MISQVDHSVILQQGTFDQARKLTTKNVTYRKKVKGQILKNTF